MDIQGEISSIEDNIRRIDEIIAILRTLQSAPAGDDEGIAPLLSRLDHIERRLDCIDESVTSLLNTNATKAGEAIAAGHRSQSATIEKDPIKIAAQEDRINRASTIGCASQCAHSRVISGRECVPLTRIVISADDARLRPVDLNIDRPWSVCAFCVHPQVAGHRRSAVSCAVARGRESLCGPEASYFERRIA